MTRNGDELGSRLAAGCDAVVLADLYDAHGQWCYRLAHGVLGEPHLANDVTQEVFLAIWSGNAVFDPARGSVSGWLARVTHNKAVDAVRRHERHNSRAARPGMLTWLEATDDVEAAAWASERQTYVLAALVKLSAAQRQVIELAYFGGHTQSEISTITATALGTVKTRTLAALRQLRTDLDLVAIANTEGWTGPFTGASAMH